MQASSPFQKGYHVPVLEIISFDETPQTTDGNIHEHFKNQTNDIVLKIFFKLFAKKWTLPTCSFYMGKEREREKQLMYMNHQCCIKNLRYERTCEVCFIYPQAPVEWPYTSPVQSGIKKFILRSYQNVSSDRMDIKTSLHLNEKPPFPILTNLINRLRTMSLIKPIQSIHKEVILSITVHCFSLYNFLC